MGSELTSRLMQLNSTIAVASGVETRLYSPPSSTVTQPSSSSLSGNSEDRESGDSEGEHTTCSGGRGLRDDHDRKRKIDDAYTAAKAQEEACGPGVPFRLSRPGRNKNFNGSIDLTTVRHKTTRETVEKLNSGKCGALHDVKTGFGGVYVQMIEKSRPFYPSCAAEITSADTSGDEACSELTSNHSDDCSSESDNGNSVQPSRISRSSFERSVVHRANSREKRHKTSLVHEPEHVTSLNKGRSRQSMSRSAMTLDQAMSISTEARLVTVAHPPFLVVHANAAFFRLSGMKTQSVIGTPLSDVLRKPSAESFVVHKDDAMLKSTVAFFGTGKREGGYASSSSNVIPGEKCIVKTFPVLMEMGDGMDLVGNPSGARSKIVTHFVLHLRSSSEEHDRLEDEFGVGSTTTTSDESKTDDSTNHPILVMG